MIIKITADSLSVSQLVDYQPVKATSGGAMHFFNWSIFWLDQERK